MFLQTIKAIRTPQELAEFIRSLKNNYVDSPQSWENADLATYLDAIAAWVKDSDGFFENNDLPRPNSEVWQVVAMVLYAASIYE